MIGNMATQLLLPFLVVLVVPKTTVFQGPPVPLVVLESFNQIGHPCTTSPQWLEGGIGNASRLQAIILQA